MSRLVLMLALMFCCSALAAQQNIGQVHFKNFTYSPSGHLLGHSSLEWLATPAHPATNRRPIPLVDGPQLTKTSSVILDGKEYGQYEGFTFESVSYGDITGDGKTEAIIVLMYHSGGTQTTNRLRLWPRGAWSKAPCLLPYREQIRFRTLRCVCKKRLARL